MQYWINNNGVQAGPIEAEDLAKMQITRDTYVWRSGMEDWEKIGDVPELAGVLAEAVGESVPEPVVEAAPIQGEIPTLEDAPVEQDVLCQQPQEEPVYVQEAEPQSEIETESIPEPASGVEYVMGDRMPRAEEQAPMQNYAQPPMQNYALEDDVDMSDCPPTNIGWSAVATILCCSVAGVVALILGTMVRPAYRRGDVKKAEKMSEWSAWLCIASIILGLISGPFMFAFSLLW